MAESRDDKQSVLPGVVLPSTSEDCSATQDVTKLMIAAFHGNLAEVNGLLLQDHGMLHLQNQHNVTVLDYAVSQKQLKIIDALIGYGLNLDILNSKGYNILHRCVLSGQLDKVQFCTGLGVSLDCRSNDGDTALILAAQKGRVEIIKYLLGLQCDASIKNRDGSTALECAFLGNHREIQLLLEEVGQSSNRIPSDIGQGLFAMASTGNHLMLDQLVSSFGADIVNFEDPTNGYATPIQCACQEGNLTIAKALKRHGAVINKYFKGQTELILAVCRGKSHIVEWLINEGALLNCRNLEGYTALHCAVIDGAIDIVQLLIHGGILLNLLAHNGSSALHIAVEKGFVLIVKLLLECGIFVDPVDNESSTPLDVATLSGNLDSIKYLVEHGANLNRPMIHGYTPLMLATNRGHFNIVKYLVHRGANVHFVSGSGATAVSVAAAMGHTEICRFLTDTVHGTNVVESRQIGEASSEEAEFGSGCQFVARHKHVSSPCLEELEFGGDNPEYVQKYFFKICETGCGSFEELETLISRGADVNWKNEQGITPLIAAVLHNHEVFVKWLVLNNAQVDIADAHGMTPLMIAADGGLLPIVNELIQNKADITLKDNNNRDVLQIAKLSQQLHVLSYLQSEKNKKDREIKTRFFRKLERMDFDACAQIIEGVVDTDCVDVNGRSALSHCISNGSNTAVRLALLLCTHGANVDLCDPNGKTPLQQCIDWGNIDIAEALLKHGAIVERHLPEMLIDASINTDYNMVVLLLKHIKSLQFKDVHHFTSLFLKFCVANDFRELITVFNYEEMEIKHIWQDNNAWPVKQVKVQGAFLRVCEGVNRRRDFNSDEKRTLLMLSVRHNMQDVVRCLVEKTDVIQSETKEKALSLALELGYFEVAAVLKSSFLEILDLTWPEVVIGTEGDQSQLDLGQEKKKENGLIDKSLKQIAEMMKKTLDMVHVAVLMALKSSPCEDITGMVHDVQSSVLYIYTKQGRSLHVEGFIDKMLKGVPLCSILTTQNSLLTTKVVEQTSQPLILVGSANRTTNLYVHYPEGKYSITTEIRPLTNDNPSSENCFGTAGFFIEDSCGALYAITSPYNLGLSFGQAKRFRKSGTICVLSSIDGHAFDANLKSETCYIVDNDISDDGVSLHMAAVCISSKLDRSLIGSLTRNNYVYYGSSENMVGRMVYKTGRGAGRTEGVVVSANISFQVYPGRWCHSAFIVTSLDSAASFAAPGDSAAVLAAPGDSAVSFTAPSDFAVSSADAAVPFAAPGDCGSAVIDIISGLIFGLIIAEQDNYFCRVTRMSYEKVTFCVPLYPALKYLHDKTHLQLGQFRTF